MTISGNREKDFYPHWIQNLDNLINFGGLFTPVLVQADMRETKHRILTNVPTEVGCTLVR
jgi:hypothetical protein